MQVEVESVPDGKKYPGKIKRIPSNNTANYCVEYTDNTEEDDVIENRITAIGSGEKIGGVLFLDGKEEWREVNLFSSQFFYKKLLPPPSIVNRGI